MVALKDIWRLLYQIVERFDLMQTTNFVKYCKTKSLMYMEDYQSRAEASEKIKILFLKLTEIVKIMIDKFLFLTIYQKYLGLKIYIVLLFTVLSTLMENLGILMVLLY